MKFPTKEELKKLREEFPSGCRIVLDEMDDVQAPKPGSQGTCRGVDDAGNVLVSWDGGALMIAPAFLKTDAPGRAEPGWGTV